MADNVLGVVVVGPDKKPWEHASALIGVVSALIAVVVAATQQRPASAVAVVAAVVLLGIGTVVWIVRARTTDGCSRFPRGRWVAIASSVLILAGAGIVLIVPGSRAVVTHDLLGFSSITADVKIARVLVAESDTAYRVSIVARNGTAREELATAVKFATKCPPEQPAERSDVYKIQQAFGAGVASGEPLVSGHAILAEEPTFRIPVVGQLIKRGCRESEINLSFGISVPLPANQHTSIFVDLPKRLTVPDDRQVPHPEGSPPPPPGTVDLSVPRPNGKNFVAALVVSGVELSATPDG